MFNKNNCFKYGIKQIILPLQFAIKITNLLISFCSFDLSCPILEKLIFIEHLYIVLSY